MVKTDYIIKSKTALLNLQEFQDHFSLEAKVIWHAKCILMQNEDLDNYYVDGVYVNVDNINGGYQLRYLDYIVDITVFDKMIIDYTIET